MFCTKCGNKLPDNARFCTKCGAKIDFTPSSPASASSPYAYDNGPQPTPYPYNGRPYGSTVGNRRTEPDNTLPMPPVLESKPPETTASFPAVATSVPQTMDTSVASSGGKSNAPLVAVVIILVLALIGGGGYWFLSRNGVLQKAATTTSSSSSTTSSSSSNAANKSTFMSQDVYKLAGYLEADPTWISGYLSSKGYSYSSPSWQTSNTNGSTRGGDYLEYMRFISGASDSTSNMQFSYLSQSQIDGGTKPAGVEYFWTHSALTSEKNGDVKSHFAFDSDYYIKQCGLGNEGSMCSYTTNPDLYRSRYQGINEFCYRVGTAQVGGSTYAWVYEVFGVTGSDRSCTLALMDMATFKEAYSGISPTDSNAAYSIADS